MRKRKIFLIPMISVLLIMTILSGCTGGSSSGAIDAVTDNQTFGLLTGENSINTEDNYESTDESEGKDVTDERKIIETISYSIQTKEFDNLVLNIESKVKENGGYIEESDVRNYNYEGSSKRNASMTVRIPTSKKEGFENFISESGTVANRTVETEDVTLKYVDVQSRLKALNAEKESLEEILKNADTVDDIITVRKELTNVIYEIESYQSQLKKYDNLIDYTTFNISIEEVKDPINIKGKSLGKRIADSFLSNISGLKAFFSWLIVFIIGGSPVFLLLGVIITVIVLIVKNKKRNK